MKRHDSVQGLFQQTRLHLALAYGGVMGLMILGVGLLFYQLMSRSHWLATDHELSLVAATLHDAIEPNLGPPNQLSSEVTQLVPGLQRPAQGQSSDDLISLMRPSPTTLLSQQDYYIRLLGKQTQVLATLGRVPHNLGKIPSEINRSEQPSHPSIDRQILWQREGRYRQMMLSLHDATGQHWGYLQVGQSLQLMDRHMSQTRWALLLGMPVSLLMISWAAWEFAGLAITPLQLAYRQIQQFTVDAAHELRTPLTASRTTLELLLAMAPPETHGSIAVVLRQQERLGQLVQDLLLLSRLDLQGSMGPGAGLGHSFDSPGRSVNLQELLEDLVEELMGLAIAADLTLELEAPTAIWTWGNADRLCRLLGNLLDNAIQHGKSRVTVQLRRQDNLALIEVIDDGKGIAPEHQPHVFDRFYRVDGDRSRRRGGTGLGLAIAKAIAIAHQGQISFTSLPGRGTTFSVALPLLRGPLPGELAGPERGESPTRPSAGLPPGLQPD